MLKAKERGGCQSPRCFIVLLRTVVKMQPRAMGLSLRASFRFEFEQVFGSIMMRGMLTDVNDKQLLTLPSCRPFSR